jgi:alkyldihydroxyacetonephosphate synthase
MAERRLKFWGWGYEDQGVPPHVEQYLGAYIAQRFGWDRLEATPPPTVEEVRPFLRRPRIAVPDVLAPICSVDPYDRLAHTYGKSYRDVIRAYRRDFSNAPDVVAFPRSEEEIVRLLDWCSETGVAAIPFGGGTSVVGGVEPVVGEGYKGIVSMDLRRLDKVLEIDRESRAARIQAGVRGPALEDQLKPHGYTLRHYPQSFEFSTLGGWIATRAGGHYATLYTHIDDFVESLRIVTPAGVVATRRLPGSGAGPSPDRLFIGSEGTLGIITEAWMRLQDRPVFRSSATVRFPDFLTGARAVRAISQSGLYPSNCRLLDPLEARDSGTGDGTAALLLLGFESADHPVDAWMERALECCSDFGGRYDPGAVGTKNGREETADTWRNAFFQAPYLRDYLAGLGVIVETFETAVTWDRFAELYQGVQDATMKAMDDICGPGGWVTCRFTHVYTDGPAPYFTVKAPGRKGAELEQWEAIKAAASDAILRLGGTITHHHAVGRDHRPWYDRQRPPLFGASLQAVKKMLDPAQILNPGVLLDGRSGSSV